MSVSSKKTQIIFFFLDGKVVYDCSFFFFSYVGLLEGFKGLFVGICVGLLDGINVGLFVGVNVAIVGFCVD